MADRSNPVTEDGMEETRKTSAEQKIVQHGRIWRELDKKAIANKRDTQKQRDEYRARRELAKVIDDAKDSPP